jgi:hypothetical protein
LLKRKLKIDLEELQLLKQQMSGQGIRRRLKKGLQGKNLEEASLVVTVLIGALIGSLIGMMMTIQD